MSPILYLKLGIVAVLIVLSNALIYYVMDARYDKLQSSYSNDMLELMHERDKVQDELQGVIDVNSRKSQNEINRISNNLTIALNSLRDRPDRPNPDTPSTGNPTGATGAELYRVDAEFLTREAARAETLRERLGQCYKDYNKVKDTINALRDKPG